MRTADATLIRDGSNTLFALPGNVIARVGRPGRLAVAEREVRASRWLADNGIPVVRTLPEVDQPTEVGDRGVTWWVRLPEHRNATPAELGAVLRELHALPIPHELALPQVDPFDGLTDRIGAAAWLPDEDRTWLYEEVERLRVEHADLPSGLPLSVVHGDAWQGNVAVSNGSPVLLDLEDIGLGRPEWDLVSLAVDHTDFDRISSSDYRDFVNSYGGYDVTAWRGYRTLATIRELRWAGFTLDKAATSQEAAREAQHRTACLRGEVSRPWSWLAF
ncbi:aminoglycoside phosphotransferase family protein [Allokutzneria multivorans]|uniref:aminoglycoside phosphotransferase family protein n=1 Tax=Allokutzneria multivorans TaxID=1142134 RepID=UPI0031F08B75